MKRKHSGMLRLPVALLLLPALLFVACDSNGVSSSNDDGTGDPSEEERKYTSAYQLNVVYFVPTDNPPKQNYEERISEILLHVQSFYGKYMKRWGYGERSFGLPMENSSTVDITRINADGPASDYPYEGGGSAVKEEVQAYMEANPDAKNSDHYLVLLPENEDGAGAPYYGLGQGWAFATDYEVMDVDNLGRERDATVYIGGLAHELGHGLLLPHTTHHASENERLGMALMDAGNSTYGDAPTFLTKRSAAILNVGQLFSETKGEFYGSARARLKRIQGTVEGDNVVVEGTYETDVPVSEAIVYQDPEGRSNYNAMGWVASVSGQQFETQMPVAELTKTDAGTDYEMYVRLIHENGTLSFFPVTTYAFRESGEPKVNFDLGPRDDTIDRREWQIADFSSEEIGYDRYASNILDGDISTFWHSRWSDRDPSPTHPHFVTIKMGDEPSSVRGLEFVQRQNGQRKIRGLEVEMSTDGETWMSMGTYELEKTTVAQSIRFNREKDARYIRLTTRSSWDESGLASLAEVRAF